MNPFKHRKGSVERGTAWKKIASNLNASSNMKFAVSRSSVRNYLVLPQKKYRKKMRQEKQPSGISPEKTELDELIEEINDIEEMAASEHQEAGRIKQDKADQDKNKACDMRRKAMETLGETKKRQAQDEKENQREDKRKRRSGGDTIEYLKERYAHERATKEEEKELKRKMHEFEMKKHDLFLEKQQ